MLHKCIQFFLTYKYGTSIFVVNVKKKVFLKILLNVVVLEWSTTVVHHFYNKNVKFYSKAAAPEIISISSLVITACLVRLNVKVSFPIISAKIKKRKCMNDKNYNRLNKKKKL